MKLIKKINLRIRLTLLMGVVLTIACIAFLLASNASARDVYKSDLTNTKPPDLTNMKPPDIYPDILIQNGNIIQSIREVQDDEFAAKNMVIAILIIVIGVSSTYFIVKSAMKPIKTLSSEINRVSEHNLSTRIAVPDTKDEVASLAESFNKMVSRIEAAFLSQKNFSANAAHELRTPLTAMIANIEVCRMDEQPSLDECIETLDDVLNNAHRLNTLVNDLLMINADGGITLNEEIDAKQLIDQIIGELSKSNEKEINFINNLKSDNNFKSDNNLESIILFGNKSLIYRAFFNLLHNGMRYNNHGGSVTISGRIEKDMNVIIISDTGIGIPKDSIDKIFDSFYCVDKSRSRELGGSGLGLSIVKSIIKKHKGFIVVKSEPKKFTEFTVYLPR